MQHLGLHEKERINKVRVNFKIAPTDEKWSNFSKN